VHVMGWETTCTRERISIKSSQRTWMTRIAHLDSPSHDEASDAGSVQGASDVQNNRIQYGQMVRPNVVLGEADDRIQVAEAVRSVRTLGPSGGADVEVEEVAVWVVAGAAGVAAKLGQRRAQRHMRLVWAEVAEVKPVQSTRSSQAQQGAAQVGPSLYRFRCFNVCVFGRGLGAPVRLCEE